VTALPVNVMTYDNWIAIIGEASRGENYENIRDRKIFSLAFYRRSHG